MDVVVEYDKKKLQRLAQAFPKAAVSSLNRVGKSTRTQISSLIREKYNIKKSDLDKTIGKPWKAIPSDLRSKIIIKGSPTPVFKFGGKPSVPKQRASVSVMIRRGRRISISRYHAFVAKMSSGHIGIFYRTGEKVIPTKGRYEPAGIFREKIQEIYTLSTADMAGSVEIAKKVESFWRTELVKVFTHNINFFRK
jgi:hypothetical protein